MSLSSECATSAYASEDVVSHCVVSWVRPGRFRYNACHQTSSMLWHSGGYFAVGYFAMARWLCTSVPWARMVRLHRPSTAAVGKTGATGLKKQEVALLTAAAASRRAEAAFRCCLSTSRAVIRAADYHGILRVISLIPQCLQSGGVACNGRTATNVGFRFLSAQRTSNVRGPRQSWLASLFALVQTCGWPMCQTVAACSRTREL